MGPPLQINPARIAKHGQDLTTTVHTPLNAARDLLNTGGTLEGGDFSITGTMAGMAYPMALQFAYEDLNTHLEMLAGYAKRIDATAKTYAASEDASTIRTV
ncbi:hypothetical protein [Actinomadura flavalba]|uniref:hypothetical protein n=1 Tax=Actinomadura flavalba TaxID=1120938 RepID=UPI000373277A|nr:hypothetical protein [Actinomadura flavalba]